MVLRFFLRMLDKHPWKTQIIISGGLAGSGDIIAQFGLERRSLHQFDAARTVRFAGFGALFFAPILRVWYGVLERYVHFRAIPKLSPMLRVAVDQTCFGPCLLTVFLILLRLAEGNDSNVAIKRWKDDFSDIFFTGLKIWPAVQLVNFYFVPLQFRMLLIQTISVFWNSYLAWRTNKHADLVGTNALRMMWTRNLWSAIAPVWRAYLVALDKKPLLTQMATTGCLMAAGDVMSQIGIERKLSQGGYDPKRTLRFFALGCFYIAPILRRWFIYVERNIHVAKYPRFSPAKRMIIDQLVVGPCITSSFLILLRILENNDLKTSVTRWRQDFPDIFVTGLMVWPAAQLVNFYLIPLQHRILYVQTLALAWNTYLAWRCGRNE